MNPGRALLQVDVLSTHIDGDILISIPLRVGTLWVKPKYLRPYVEPPYEPQIGDIVSWEAFAGESAGRVTGVNPLRVNYVGFDLSMVKLVYRP